MVALTGLITSDFYSSGSYIIDTPQKLIDRIQLDQDGGTIDVPSLSGAGTDSGEPNSAGYTATLWYELPVDSSIAEDVRVLLTDGTSVGSVTVYSSSVADPTENIEPTYASLTQIQAPVLDQIIVVDPDWQSLYLQVGMTSGDGAGFTLTWGDADPLEGGTFADPYIIDGESGFADGETKNAWLESGEPVPGGITPVRSIWFRWESPDPPPDGVTFRVSTAVEADFSVAVYTGTAVNALTAITSIVATGPASAIVEFAPSTGGAFYYVQVASEEAEGEYSIEWFTPAEIVEPAEIFDYISVRAYNRTGQTLITELKNRTGIQFQESLNTPGTGQVSVPMNDEVLAALNPLADGNIIKFWFGNKCVSGFRIAQTEFKMISTGEQSERMITVSGPTVHQMLDDFIVMHENGNLGNPHSKSERTFSWASGVFPGYNPAQWNERINANSLTNPPGGAPGAAPRSRPKWGHPKKWPDRRALWMWISQDFRQNEGRWRPKRKILGQHYYRKTFVIKNASERVRMWSSSDDWHEVWLDGEKVIESRENESGYKTFKTFTTRLAKGRHTIAVFVQDRNPVGDRNEAFLFSMASLWPNGRAKQVLMRSSRNWAAWHGPNPPTWNRAKILRRVHLDARNIRKNTAALALTVGFTDTHDSYGKAWTDRVTMSVKVGTSTLDLQSQLSESARFDVWVDPTDMKIHAYNRRGKDKSKNVALDLGYNLGEYTITSTNRVKNKILVQFVRGFVWAMMPASINRYGGREGYVELGGARNAVTARSIVQAAARYVSESDQSSGTPDIVQRPINEPQNNLIGVEGAYPFLDFNVGDIISAPNTSGNMAKHRVISLSCTESADGKVTFDPDLEPWGV